MKKILPYLLIALALVAVIFLVFTGRNNRPSKKYLDQRLSLKKKDKIPYGAFVAFESLKSLFPSASVSVNKNEPGFWDSLSSYDSGQALIVVAPVFNADEFEMKKIVRFVESGNDVFISAVNLSADVKRLLDCETSYTDLLDYYAGGFQSLPDTLSVSLAQPPFSRTGTYSFPGKKFESHFYRINNLLATVLGNDHDGHPNFVHLRAGSGHLYLHLAPLVFSNYFLLRNQNIQYYEDMLSVLSPSTRKVVWDEYFINKKAAQPDEKKGRKGEWLSALFKHESLKWALLTAMLALLLFVLLEMRRKQRPIPVIHQPRNDSMDFVKTIGRLYFDKGDHKNLCRKMAAYFLEHVRNRYKLATGEMNEAFIKNLQFKTGVDEAEIRAIAGFIRKLDESDMISDQQLAFFHKQLESFYQKA